MMKQIAGRMRCGFRIVCGLLSISAAAAAGGQAGGDNLQCALQVSRWGTVCIRNNDDVLVARDPFLVRNASGDELFRLDEKRYVSNVTLWIPEEEDPVFVEPVIDERNEQDGTKTVTVQAAQNGLVSVAKEIRLRCGTVEVALNWEVFQDVRAEYVFLIPAGMYSRYALSGAAVEKTLDSLSREEIFPESASEIVFLGEMASLELKIKDTGSAQWKSLREYREGRKRFYRLSLALACTSGKKNTAEVIVEIKGLTCK